MSQGDPGFNCMMLCWLHSPILSRLVHTKVQHITWLLCILFIYYFCSIIQWEKSSHSFCLLFLQLPFSALLLFLPCICTFLLLPVSPSLKHSQYLSFLKFSIFTFYLCSILLKDRIVVIDFFLSVTTSVQSERLLHNGGMRRVSVLSSQAAWRFRLMSLQRATLVKLSLPPRGIATYFKNQ